MLIRCLLGRDAGDYRALRLRGFREHPEAFTSSYEEESLRPLDDAVQRLGAAATASFWGAFCGRRAGGHRRQPGAERLYLDAGFASYGIEPGAIKVLNQRFDKNHMFLQLGSTS